MSVIDGPESTSLISTLPRRRCPSSVSPKRYPPAPYAKIVPPLKSKDTRFVLLLFIQASIVKFCSWRLAGLPTDAASPLPSSTNACPTRPGPKLVLPTSVPLLESAASSALFSPFHQLTKPNEGGVQFVGGVDVGHLPALAAL